ncbi:MAG: portal protein [Steroidobacteraceae bacterium]
MDPGMAGIVDVPAASSLSDDDVVRQVLKKRDESMRQRQSLEPDWRWLESLYRNHTAEQQGKQSWQSAVTFQEVFNKIETAASLFKAALLDPPEWFRFQTRLPQADETQVRFIQRVMDLVVQDSGFIDEYIQALKDALLLGSGCVRLSWEQWVDTSPQLIDVPLFDDPMLMQYLQMQGQQVTRKIVSPNPRVRTGIKATYVPIWSMYPDPFADHAGKGKWMIEECMMDSADVDDAFMSGKFRPEAKDKLGEPVSSRYETDERYRNTELFEARDSKRRRHLITEYWGDLTDDDGRVIIKNWRVTVGNDRCILRMSRNPFWSGFFPYIWTVPVRWPGRPWGRSISLPAANKQEGYNKVVNLMIDNFMYSVLQAFTYDTTAAMSGSDIGSIEPGKVYKGRGNDFIRPLQFNANIQQGYPILNLFSQGIDEDMRINEFAEGAPTSRGRPTKFEIQQKTGRSDAIITNLARDLERHDLEPALRMMFEMYWQYGGDLANPALKELVQAWAGPVEFLSDEMRLQMLAADFQIQVRGITGVFSRDDLIQKMQQCFSLLQSIPAPPQTMVAMVYQIIQAMGLDPQFNLWMPKSPEEFVQMQQMAAMNQQAQLANGGVPPAGGQSRSAGSAGGSPQAPPPPQSPVGPA